MADELIATPETALLGIALTQPRALDDADHLTPEDFEDEQAGSIWATILRLATQNRPHNVASVSAIGDHDRELLSDLAYSAPIGAAADYYADLVERNATRRRLQQTAGRIAQMATDADLDQIPDIVEIARAEIDEAGRTGSVIEGIDSGDHFVQHLETLGQAPRLDPTPWPDLDHLIGGWRPGALYVIGARPSVGKSVIGLQAAVGLQQNGPALFASMEMGRSEIQNRLIAQTASVSLKTFESAMAEQHWNRISQHTDVLSNYRIRIDDRESLTPTEIRSTARSMARKAGLSGIVVDYLQLMSSPRGDRRPRHEVVTDYSRRLKKLAKELDVPVIALAQLNRETTQRGDGLPRISDLRESGSIEQDADVVILLHSDPDNHPGDLFMNVGKNRHGPRGSFKLAFEGQYARANTQAAWTPKVITG